MLPCVPIRAEGARYATSLLFLPGLWMRPRSLQAVAGLLGHRGWEGGIADLGGRTDGLAGRADAVAEVVRALPTPPVLVAHDVGGLIARRVARVAPVRAIVWLAPLMPGDGTLASLLAPWRVAAATALGRPIAPPGGSGGARLLGRGPGADLADGEGGRLVLDALRPRALEALADLPQACVMGEADPIAALVGPVAGERLVLAGQGRWLLGGTAWQACAGVVHRWLVTHLGAGLLEFYEEAMAEREQAGDE